MSGLLGAWHGPDDVRISGVSDGEGAHTHVLSTRGAQLVVVPGVVVDSGLGQHGVILDLRLAERGSVVVARGGEGLFTRGGGGICTKGGEGIFTKGGRAFSQGGGGKSLYIFSVAF